VYAVSEESLTWEAMQQRGGRHRQLREAATGIPPQPPIQTYSMSDLGNRVSSSVALQGDFPI
jgi:hypothetical protein